MQTKHEIKSLLAAAGVNPKKHLGQNFLIDLNLMRRLVEYAKITADDCILEVGCGTGSLTGALAECAGHVVAVDTDHDVYQIARSQLADCSNVTLINTDILASKHRLADEVMRQIAEQRKSCPGRFLLVANLPYSVACPVMINLITSQVSVDAMYVTVQKEVAQRMTAATATEHYGSLSIILAAAGEIEILKILKPSVFWPRPRVDSAMISFVRSEEKLAQIADLDLFSELVSLFMQHRRKMIKAITKFATGRLEGVADWQKIFSEAGVDPKARPEMLMPKDYTKITSLIAVLF